MNERTFVERELEQIDRKLRELVTGYEQYFAGVEKREPMLDREKLAKRLRKLVTRRITQTELRFRTQNLSARYNSYSGYWDRILRLIDEGRYFRQTQGITPPKLPPEPVSSPIDKLYRQILEAHNAGQITGSPPDRQQVARFLERQQEKIREKYGTDEVDFRVDVEDGKPKIKVRPHRQE